MSLLQGIKRLLLIVIFCVTSPARADLLEDILDRGTLRVGVSMFAPWTMESKSGDLIGFEIDLARQVAADMGVEPELRVYVWEEIVAALQAGEIDMIAGGMAITPARALEVNFSIPYGESGVALAANTSMTENIDSLEALDDADIVVTVTAQTLANDVASRVFKRADVRAFPTHEEAERAVLEGEAHAYVASMPEAVFLVLRNPRTVDLPLDELLLASSEALAVRKGEQDWLNFLNAWIEARRADRWLPVTRAYWFNSIDWAGEVAAQ
jgi:polar amino acid transport system substrate-binding protein